MKNTKKGFTLVELLVVIAILAILATVSVVGYTVYINDAKNSNARTEAAPIETYVSTELMIDGSTPVKVGSVGGNPVYVIKDGSDYKLVNADKTAFTGEGDVTLITGLEVNGTVKVVGGKLVYYIKGGSDGKGSYTIFSE